MKASDRKKLSDAMSQMLQLRGLTSSQEKQIDGLKKIVTDICQANQKDFNDEGVLEVEGVGIVKIVQQAPTLIMRHNGKAPNDIELVGLIAELGGSFQKPTVYVTMIRDEVAKKNKDVIKVLKKHQIDLVTGERFDVKKEAKS